MNATIPITATDNNTRVVCSFGGTGVTSDAPGGPATTSFETFTASSPHVTLPLSDSIRVTTATPTGTVDVNCTISNTSSGNAVVTAVVSGVSITADRKTTLNGVDP
ncbi:hypothetical protein KSZ_35800 [Dictyobacter formicarum]|uniref:Ig-like domain-containing protein n=2 Tax=Dictyobacter formicarum TaxID=2778368 RepID=A0ABQ3VHB5_9CHLR|nr:hypothetical protein KSZ_35800 [Dictyobacter formicarum]